jgi:predicted cobalt transporter CbtA
MMNFGLKGLLLLLAIVLFIVGALSDENKQDLLFWGLAIFAASFIVDAIPLASMMGNTRTRDRT